MNECGLPKRWPRKAAYDAPLLSYRQARTPCFGATNALSRAQYHNTLPPAEPQSGYLHVALLRDGCCERRYGSFTICFVLRIVAHAPSCTKRDRKITNQSLRGASFLLLTLIPRQLPDIENIQIAPSSLHRLSIVFSPLCRGPLVLLLWLGISLTPWTLVPSIPEQIEQLCNARITRFPSFSVRKVDPTSRNQ
jgi:hypothetical protein